MWGYLHHRATPVADVAGLAAFAIELNRSREDTEDERVPQEEERVKLTDRRLADD